MRKLIVFDVDGVLVNKRSSWIMVHQGLGKTMVNKCSRLRKKYFHSQKMTYEDWAKKDIKLWGNVSLEKIKKILDKVPLMKRAEEVCKILKEKDYLLAMISTGINLLIERIGKRLNFDYLICNEIYKKKGKLSAKINVSLDQKTKDKVLRELIRKIGVNKKNIIVIGDDDDDYPMMRLAKFSILFNPNPSKSTLAKKRANIVVESKNLRDVLKYL